MQLCKLGVPVGDTAVTSVGFNGHDCKSQMLLTSTVTFYAMAPVLRFKVAICGFSTLLLSGYPSQSLADRAENHSQLTSSWTEGD